MKCSRHRLYTNPNVKEHLIHNGWDSSFKVWRGPCSKDISNEEWEEHFRVLIRQQTQDLDFAFDMRAMVANAFQQTNDPMVLEARTLDVMEETFKVADGFRREGMRVNQMVMLKFLLIARANNLWEM
jgi:hypothetical protein